MLYNVWVTRQCNLSCKYCYEGNNKEEKNLKDENIDKIISFIKNTNRYNNKILVNFHGGEPLLRFDMIRKFISKVKNNNIEAKYLLTTNGTLLTDSIIDYITKNDVKLSYSMDGASKVHDENRIFKNGIGTYNIVKKNLIKLLDKLPDTRIRVTFNSSSVAYLMNSVEHLIMLGCKVIVLGPDYFDKNWNKETIKEFGIQLKKIKNYSNNKDVYISFVNSDDYKKLGRCSGGISEFNIDVDGSIYPCTFIVGNPKFKIGTLDDGLINRKIGELKTIYNTHSDKCLECNYLDYCITDRCKFLNYGLNGKLEEPSCVVCLMENEKINMILESYKKI